MNLSELSVKKPVAFTMLFAAIFGIGIVALTQLHPELMPDITFPVISVSVKYPNVGPQEVESLVTKPIEGIVSTVTNVKTVSSIISEGRSTTIIEFNWGTDMDAAAADVREKLDLIAPRMPDGAEDPMVFKFNLSMMPVMFLAVTGKENLAQLREMAEEEVKPKLERIEGVARAAVEGGLKREIQVRLNRNKMYGYGLSAERIVKTLQAENLNFPGGKIKQGFKEPLLRVPGEFKSVDEIGNVIVSRKDGAPIYLKEIAQVRDTFQEKQGIARVNGKPGVMVLIMKSPDAVTVDVSHKVKGELSKIDKTLPRGVSTRILMDQAEYINRSIGRVVEVAIQGAILAALILLLFLRNISSTFIIAFSIPMSVIATFTVMYAGGITLNMMSMGGLALAIGMLVDSAIVVLENTFRHQEEGKTPEQAAITGASEVSTPITASILTTVSVFLPVVFIPGIVGVFTEDLGLTVSFSLLASLFVALMLVPLLCSKFLRIKRAKEGKVNELSNKIGMWFERLESSYRKSLNWCLANRKKVILSAVGLFILSIFMIYPFRLIGTEFIPKGDEGWITIKVEKPPGTKLEKTEETVKKIERIIYEEKIPELENLHATGGGGIMERVTGQRAGSHLATLQLELVGSSQRERSQWEVIEQLRSKLEDIPGTKISISGGYPERRMFGGGNPISVEIRGHNLQKSREIANKVASIIEQIRGTKDVNIDLQEPNPELEIVVDRDKASSLGLNVAKIANAVNSSVSGKVASKFRQGGDEYDIRVRLQKQDREDREDLESLPLKTPFGSVISLQSIASLRPASGPPVINRKEQERVVTVNADVEGRDLGSVAREVKRELSKLNLPNEFSIEMVGQAAEQRESFRWLTIALIGAVFLVYMIMASFFESFLDPFVIMLTFPLAIIGVLWLLFLTGTTLSVIAFIGAVMLAGIIVNNAIVMVHYINLLRQRGRELKEAVILGGCRRLRPVLMTAFTTIFAMLPMAFGLGEGAELRAPMARAVVGGLIMGTFLTLLIIPTVYAAFGELRSKRKE